MALPLLLNTYGAIIAATASLSSSYTFSTSGQDGGPATAAGGVCFGADVLSAIQIPGVWTAANLTFQVSPDGGITWCEMYDDQGAAVTVTAVAGAFIALNKYPFYAWRGANMIKVRSGTLGTPVVQSASNPTTIYLYARPDNY